MGGGGGGGQVSAASASLEQEAGALSLAADEAGASNGALRQQLAAAEAQLYELSLRHAAEVRAASAAQPTPTTAQRPIRMQRHKAPPKLCQSHSALAPTVRWARVLRCGRARVRAGGGCAGARLLTPWIAGGGDQCRRVRGRRRRRRC